MISSDLEFAIGSLADATSLLVASDYDGVMSPIVSDPAAAQPDRAAVDALVMLAAMPNTHAVAISGRSLATLSSLIGHVPGVVLVGTHGAEESGYAVPTALEDAVSSLHNSLLSLSRTYEGSVLERKPLGAAFHYRHVSDQEGAAEEVRRVAAAAGARTITGKFVIECIFGDANKGSALERLRDRYGAAAVLFIGDDTTDEDAFAVLREGDVGLKVGPGETCANYRIADQRHVAAVLEMLAHRRSLLEQPQRPM